MHGDGQMITTEGKVIQGFWEYGKKNRNTGEKSSASKDLHLSY